MVIGLGGYFVAVLAAQSAIAAIDCEGTLKIGQIQGSSHVSPYNGVEVETCGVVTAVASNGYYLQDPAGDGDIETSDGIFVFKTGERPAVGDFLRVSDVVSESIPGGPGTGNLSITQLSFPTIIASETGHALPKPVVIGQSGRIPPNRKVISKTETNPAINLQKAADAATNRFNPKKDGIDFYESLEGMLVTVESPVAVSAIRQFGSSSAEVFVLANEGADAAPRKARTSRGGINLQKNPDNLGDQNPERVQIQFDSTLFGSTDYPAIKVGDQLSDVTGVMGYSFGNFEVNALGPVKISPSLIAQETTWVTNSHNRLTIATYNILNLSADDSDADQRAEVGHQIAVNLQAPDIIALQEVQDNNGQADEGVLDASATLQAIIDAITAAGGPEYAGFDVAPTVATTDDNRDDPDTFGGVSFGNIRNAFLYNPARVSLISCTGLNRDVLEGRGVSVETAFDFSRDPLEAVFDFNGEEVILINNHFTSRFGSSPIFGAIQPFIQAGEIDREEQSLAMNEVTHWHIEQNSCANVVILGDLNTFEFTNDLKEILPGVGKDKVLYNLVKRNLDDNNYSFIFEGNSQVLDHIFVTGTLRRGARFDFVHVNNDFPRRFDDVVGSDHEPLVASLKFGRKYYEKRSGDKCRYKKH